MATRESMITAIKNKYPWADILHESCEFGCHIFDVLDIGGVYITILPEGTAHEADNYDVSEVDINYELPVSFSGDVRECELHRERIRGIIESAGFAIFRGSDTPVNVAITKSIDDVSEENVLEYVEKLKSLLTQYSLPFGIFYRKTSVPLQNAFA